MVLLVVATGCGGAGAGGGEISGTVEVPAGGDSPADECIPWTDWLDVGPGTKVTITNESGEIVASSTLTASEEIFVPHEPTGDGLYESLWTRSCVFVQRDARRPVSRSRSATAKVLPTRAPNSRRRAGGWMFCLASKPGSSGTQNPLSVGRSRLERWQIHRRDRGNRNPKAGVLTAFRGP